MSFTTSRLAVKQTSLIEDSLCLYRRTKISSFALLQPKRNFRFHQIRLRDEDERNAFRLSSSPHLHFGSVGSAVADCLARKSKDQIMI